MTGLSDDWKQPLNWGSYYQTDLFEEVSQLAFKLMRTTFLNNVLLQAEQHLKK